MPSITHVIPYVGRQMGGPVAAVADYAAALVQRGCNVSVVTAPRPGDGEPITFPAAAEVVTFDDSLGGMFRWCPAMKRYLGGATSGIVHSHGLWTYASHAAGAAARRRRLPHVLAPCGMLQADALRRSPWKKRVCRIAFQDRVLKDAACLHAKSATEAKGFREFGLTNPIAVIPNAVPMPADLKALDPEPFRARHAKPGQRIVLYLGRIHQVKGIGRLVEAWACVARRFPDWRLAIVGPDEGNMVAGLRARLSELAGREAQDSVHFVGPLQGLEKWRAYRAASLFAMPSDFENFGSAIVEAMAAGLPVITTTGAPWEDVPARDAGWRVETTVEALVGALAEAMGKSEEQRRAMGLRASEIAAGFSLEVVGDRLIRLYQWLQGGARPEFVA